MRCCYFTFARWSTSISILIALILVFGSRSFLGPSSSTYSLTTATSTQSRTNTVLTVSLEFGSYRTIPFRGNRAEVLASDPGYSTRRRVWGRKIASASFVSLKKCGELRLHACTSHSAAMTRVALSVVTPPLSAANDWYYQYGTTYGTMPSKGVLLPWPPTSSTRY